MFATYNVRADRLTVLKTTFPEELILTSRAPKAAPKVISVVAFRCAIVAVLQGSSCIYSSSSSSSTFLAHLGGGTHFDYCSCSAKSVSTLGHVCRKYSIQAQKT